ncbi:MAG: head-tail connector protein [Clostridia bacterium]|jgi:uncharacterized phage protein (predicted DNA packaging)|nr:head-tail connector protein [Clostridia bacterium]
MELEEVKKFLQVDFDDDDDYINLLIEGSEDYIKNAVGFFDTSVALCKIAAMTIISTLYTKRSFTLTTADEKSVILRSILMQLKYSSHAADESEGDA